MKKFLFLFFLGVALFAISANSLTPKVLYTLEDDEDAITYALNKNLQPQHIVFQYEGNNTTKVSILSLNSFSVEKTFTIPFNYYNLEEIGGDPYGIIAFTQNLFNSDDKWEYVIWDGDTYTQSVYNEDGECLGVLNNYIIEMVVINGNAACFFGFNEDDEYCYFQFNGSNAGVRSVSLDTHEVKAYPNPVRENAGLNIELASPLTLDGKLKIFDTAGKLVYRQHINAGTQSITVPSVKVRKGLYFYVIEKGNQILCSDKLIVD